MKQHIELLVSEYIADPNCRPELWISYETPIQSERDQFVNDQRIKQAYEKYVLKSLINYPVS